MRAWGLLVSEVEPERHLWKHGRYGGRGDADEQQQQQQQEEEEQRLMSGLEEGLLAPSDTEGSGHARPRRMKLELPDDALRTVMEFLDARDVCLLSQTSVGMRKLILSANLVWKERCARDFAPMTMLLQRCLEDSSRRRKTECVVDDEGIETDHDHYRHSPKPGEPTDRNKHKEPEDKIQEAPPACLPQPRPSGFHNMYRLAFQRRKRYAAVAREEMGMQALLEAHRQELVRKARRLRCLNRGLPMAAISFTPALSLLLLMIKLDGAAANGPLAIPWTIVFAPIMFGASVILASTLSFLVRSDALLKVATEVAPNHYASFPSTGTVWDDLPVDDCPVHAVAGALYKDVLICRWYRFLAKLNLVFFTIGVAAFALQTVVLPLKLDGAVAFLTRASWLETCTPLFAAFAIALITRAISNKCMRRHPPVVIRAWFCVVATSACLLVGPALLWCLNADGQWPHWLYAVRHSPTIIAAPAIGFFAVIGILLVAALVAMCVRSHAVNKDEFGRICVMYLMLASSLVASLIVLEGAWAMYLSVCLLPAAVLAVVFAIFMLRTSRGNRWFC